MPLRTGEGLLMHWAGHSTLSYSGGLVTPFLWVSNIGMAVTEDGVENPQIEPLRFFGDLFESQAMRTGSGTVCGPY